MKVAEQIIKEGYDYLKEDNVDEALKLFRQAAVIASTLNENELYEELAFFLSYTVSKYYREKQKEKYGNANFYDYAPVNEFKAWDDISIAAILLAPKDPLLTRVLCKFLGRNKEGVRFIRRYAFGEPLKSWTSEKGDRYTRFTQTRHVKNKLGV